MIKKCNSPHKAEYVFSVVSDRTFIGLIFLIFTHILINYIWLVKDNFPLWFDYGGYFERSIEMYYASQASLIDFAKAILGAGKYSHAYHPHRFMLPLSSVPWYYIFGTTADVAVMSCTVFLAIALFSTYAIASRLFNRFTGLMAAFILSVSPGFFTFSRRYAPEFAVIGMIAFTAYLFLRSENFKNRFYSILFGVSCALSMLVKESALPFILGLFVYGIYKSKLFSMFRLGYLQQNKKIFFNAIIALFTFGIILFFIYWPHREHILDFIFNTAYSSDRRKLRGMVDPYSLKGLLFYCRLTFWHGLSPLFFIFSVIGAFFCMKERSANRGFFLAWIVVSYIFFCSTQTRCYEYSLPFLIPLAILASHGLNYMIKNVRLKVVFLVFFVILGMMKIAICSFPIITEIPRWAYRINAISFPGFRDFHPVNEDWRLGEIVDYICDNKNDMNKKDTVCVEANLKAFSSMTLCYVAMQKKAKLAFLSGGHYSSPIEFIFSCRFVVVKSGKHQGGFYRFEQMKELKKLLDENTDFAKLPRTFLVADGSVIEIYKKI